MRCGASPSNRVANRPTAKPPASKSVFINCPFDDGFKPILRAMVFTIISSGYQTALVPHETPGTSSTGSVRGTGISPASGNQIVKVLPTPT